MKRWQQITFTLAVLGVCQSSHALLIDNGDGTITDTDSNLMWIQDVSYGGMQTWDDAIAWTDTLDFATFDDWRLPTADASCNINPGEFAYNCTTSELGFLYYNSLGNTALDTTPNFGPFTNFPIFPQFWTSTELAGNDAYAFDFHLGEQTGSWPWQSGSLIGGGGQHVWSKDGATSVLAVRDIVNKVPEPSSMLILSIGLILLVYTQLKRHGANFPQRLVQRIA